jgi:hypothetical protein
MRTSQPGWNEGAITLSASRSRRRTRFRTTAPPSARPVDSPNRVVSRSVRRNRAVRSGWDRLVPPSWNATKSCGRESITSRGNLGPRPTVRLSAAFDRELGEPPGSAGRRPIASGRGSRAPWHDGVSWADTTAWSSGLFGILSNRPRGRSVTTPEGTQTRLAPESARRVVVRRMIGPVRGDVKPRPFLRLVRARRDVQPVDRATRRYSPGVSENRLAALIRAVLSSPGPRRRRRAGAPRTRSGSSGNVNDTGAPTAGS